MSELSEINQNLQQGLVNMNDAASFLPDTKDHLVQFSEVQSALTKFEEVIDYLRSLIPVCSDLQSIYSLAQAHYKEAEQHVIDGTSGSTRDSAKTAREATRKISENIDVCAQDAAHSKEVLQRIQKHFGEVGSGIFMLGGNYRQMSGRTVTVRETHEIAQTATEDYLIEVNKSQS
jgi:hypothetical protein